MKKCTSILSFSLLAATLLLSIFVKASLAATTCPDGREAQYGFAHRVNDWDEIKGVFDLGANGIEIDICYSTYANAWMVSHNDLGYCWNSAAETLDEWLNGEPGVYGWKTLTHNQTLIKNMAALWVDVKTPNEANLLDAVVQIQAATPADISVVYELGELGSDSKTGFDKIKDHLKDNEGIMFWAREVGDCEAIYDYFVEQKFTRNAVDHGHAANIDEDVLIACNNTEFHDTEDPYRFKKVFTFTNYYHDSISDYVDPSHAYCTNGQIVGDPLYMWPGTISSMGPEALNWFFNILEEFYPDRRLATRADVFWPNEPPEVSVSLVSQTVQYSDGISPVIITASDIDSNDLEISIDLLDGLNLQNNGCVNNNGTLICTWTLDGRVLFGSGTYDLNFVVSDGKNEVAAISTIIVLTDDANVVFYENNPKAVNVKSVGGNSLSFDLMVYVNERFPDLADFAAYAGDISLAQASMTLKPIGPGSSVSGLCFSVGVSGVEYDSVNTFKCSFDEVPVNVYTAELTLIGEYYNGYAENVLSVYDQSLGFVTGGGWFNWPAAESDVNTYLNDSTNITFTLKYNKKGIEPQGNFQLISRKSDGTIFQVKSTAIYGIALGELSRNTETCGWASFIGKSTVFKNGFAVPEDNHEFVAYTEDCNNPGKGVDKFWIQVFDEDGNAIDVISMRKNAIDHACILKGGNLVVPHGRGR